MAATGTSGGRVVGPGRWQTFALLLPGLFFFTLFLAPSEAPPTNGPALLIDSLLRALAVVALALAVVVLVAETSVAARAAVAASALCGLVGTAVLFSGLWTPFRDWWALAGAAIAAAAALLNLYRLRQVWSGVKGVAGKVTAAVFTTAAVPLFTFWSETSYLPSQNAASLEMSTAAALQPAPDGTVHWVITSKIHNRSSIRTFVIISSLNVCRWADEVHWQRVIDPEDVPPERCEGLLAPFGERSWLDPDATLTISTPARTETASPLLQVSLRVAYARADRVIEVLDSKRVATADERGRCAEAEVWNLQPQSRLAALARRELALMYADVEGDGGGTYFFGAADHMRCVRKTGDPQMNDTRFQGLNRHLSLTEATTVWVGWPDGSPVADDATPSG
jgi:hypothetical protein